VASDADAPDAGDVLWLDFGPPTGREQGGRRPALVLSGRQYNSQSSVLVVCPITRKERDWPFEVSLPAGGLISGVVLVDQIKVFDLAARPHRRAGQLPRDILNEVRARLAVLLGIPVSN
jgi:mRNA interferase MazF